MPPAAPPRPVLEELEPRILYAADIAAAVQGWATVAQALTTAPDSSSAPATAAGVGHEIAFIDMTVPDAQSLLAGLTAQREAGRNIEIVRIEAGVDGIALIGRTLAAHQDVAAVHLLSHGSDGAVRLGAATLDATTLLARAGEIAPWSASLGADADLLIYGCDVAASAAGRELVAALAALSGADVAASDDPTGQRALGGDWTLEVTSGPVQAAPALDAAAQEAWAGLFGLDIQVSTTTSNDQTTFALDRGSQQAVALDGAGNFVVVWTSKSQDGDVDGVYARRFAADGTPLTGEILVNATTSGNQNQARVASDSAGNFVVTWADDGKEGGNVYLRRFSSLGVALTGEVLVPASKSGLQNNPVIAMNATTGDFVVAWQGQGPGDADGIWCRRFAADGTARDTSDTLVNLTNAGVEQDPAVAMDNSGRFVVTWGVANHTYFQRFDAAGVAQGSRTMVDNALGSNSGSAIAMDPSGRFTIAYREENFLPGIWARGYNADGTTRLNSFYVASGDATSPSISAAADGAFVIAYQKTGVDKLDVFVHKYGTDGSSYGSIVAGNLYTTGDQQYASVAASNRDNFVVVWSGESATQGKGISARVVTSVPPVITSDGGAAAAVLSLAEGSLAVTTVTATDGDLPAQTLSYAIAGGVDAARFTINATTGALTFATAPDFEAPADAGANNVYDVVVQVSDGALADTQAIAVTVTDLARVLTVTTTADTVDGDVSSAEALNAQPGGDGLVSLREAILAANATAGTDEIRFAIAGSGVQRIAPTSALPTVSGTLVIDGSTQTGFAGTPLIELDGQAAGSADGLTFDGASGGSTVRGLIIHGFSGNGLTLQGGNVTVQGNWIGTDTTGLAASGNAGGGIYVVSANNQIGGTTAAERNVISGNGVGDTPGIELWSSAATGNVIQGNYIGLNATGTAALPNSGEGIVIYGGAGATLIGGTAAGAGNVISGNNSPVAVGIWIQGGSGNTLQGNLIGTDAAGTAAVPNGYAGVLIDGSSDNLVGGTVAGAGNVIANAAVAHGVGVQGSGAVRNSVLGNTIYGNPQKGIDIAGVWTPAVNDGAKSATLANEGMDSPVVSVATLAGSALTVSGYVGSAAGQALFGGARVEFFIAAPDASGFGEGRTYLGALTAGSDGRFSGTLGVSGLAVGDTLTATATDSSGNTSEFGANRVVVTGLNVAPVIGSNGGGASATLSVAENTSVATTVAATDANAGSLLTYAIVGGADAAQFVIDAQTGVLAFAAVADFEAPADSGADNVYDVVVQVSDGTLTDSQTLAVTVTNVDEAPVAADVAYTTDTGLALTVSATTGLLANATDPEGGALTVSAVSAPAHGSLSLTPGPLGVAANLTNNAAVDTRPAWSADGTRIAFDSARDGNNEIYAMNADGSGLVRLTTNAADDSQAAWSPDGSRIAFMSNRDGNYDLWLMKSDGTAVTPLAATASGVSGQPVWSPDGSRIAFTSDRSGGQFEIWVVNADGTNLTRLTNQAGDDDEPVWAPDGTQIAFTSTRDGNREIYVMKADGSGQVRLTSAAGIDRSPDWSSDGSKLSFVTDRTGLTQVAMMDASGAHPVVVTSGSTAITFAVWSSDGRSMAFSQQGEIKVAAVSFPGGFVYAPDSGFAGTDSLTFVVADPAGHAATATATFSVHGAPTAEPDSYRLDEDQALAANVAGSWFDTAWTVRHTITLDNTGGAAVADAVVLVTLDASTIDYTRTQDAGQDLRFVAASGQVLAHEIESWNETGTSRVWVHVPDLAAGAAGGTIWLYHGNDSAADGQSPGQVWNRTGAQSVLHLGSTLADSAATAAAVTDSGTSVGAGRVADARVFDGVSSWIDAGSGATIDDLFNGGGTFSAWIRPTGWGELGYGRIASKASTTFASGANGDGWNLELDGARQSLIFEIGFGTTAGRWEAPVGAIRLGAWQQVTVVYDSSTTTNNPSIYVDGVALAVTEVSTPAGATRSDAALPLRLGNQALSTDRSFVGAIDEARAYDRALSAAEIEVDHRASLGAMASVGVAQGGVLGVLANDAANGAGTVTAELLTGPQHAASFSLNADGTFSYVPMADFFGSDSFSYRAVRQTLASAAATVTLDVAPMADAPVITFDGGGLTAALARPENTTTVATIAATDADGTSALRWSIAGGADAGRFAIDALTGLLAFVAPPDAEAPVDTGADGVYEVRVQVSDGLLSDGIDLTVTVTDVDEAPVGTPSDIDAAVNAVDETALPGTAVGLQLWAVDPDVTLSGVRYTLVDDAGGRFAIDGTTGVVRVAAALDYETATSHTLVARATSQDGSQADASFTIAVNDRPEAAVGPIVDVDARADAVPESAPPGTPVGLTAHAVDPDVADTLTYSLDVDAQGRFAIDAATGVLSVAGTLDAESATQHAIVVRVTSSDGSTSTQSFVVTVQDVNEFAVGTPVDADAGANVVSEQAVAGTAVGVTAAAVDSDLSTNVVSYSLGDSAGGRFAIDPVTGVVTLARTIGEEGLSAHTIALVATSADGSTASASVTIAVTLLNDHAPVIVSDGGAASAVRTIDEGTLLAASVRAVDDDRPLTLPTYGIAGGADAARFAIDAATGDLSFLQAPDAEQPVDLDGNGRYEVTVFATDGLQVATQALVIAVLDVDEYDVTAPVDANPAPDAVSENAAPGTPVGIVVQAVDADATRHVVSYSLDDAAGGRFAIDAGSGLVTVAGPIDREAQSALTIVVRATSEDGSASARAFTIAVDPVNDVAPVFTPPAGTTIAVDEGTLAVARLQAVDGDLPPQAVSYGLIGGADMNRFAIDAATGDLRFIDVPDHEAPVDANGDNRYEITVRASDGLLATDRAWTVVVNNVNEPPVLQPVDLGDRPENTSRDIGAAELLAASRDPDGDTLSVQSLRLLDGRGTLVDLGGGHWRFTPEAEWGGNATFEAVVSDGAISGTLVAQLAVRAENDPPVMQSQAIIVNAGTLTLVLQATDVDSPAQALAYGVVSTQGGRFESAQAPGAPLVQFTQADIDAGLVVFVADGSGATPDFALTLTDGTSRIAVRDPDVRVVTAATSPPVQQAAETGPATTTSAAAAAQPAARTPATPATAAAATLPAAPRVAADDPPATDMSVVVRGGAANGADGGGPGPVLVWRAHAATGESNAAFWGDLRGALAADDTRLGRSPALGAETLSASVRAALAAALDHLHADVQGESGEIELAIGGTTALTTGLSVGYVLWLARGGVLVASLMSSVPAWAGIDPLPVLAQMRREDDDAADDEIDPIEGLFARARRLVGGGGAPVHAEPVVAPTTAPAGDEPKPPKGESA